MDQSSTLRVGVDSRDMERGARQGEQALDRLGRKATATETQFERLERRMSGLRTLFASIGVGLAVREFGRMLDVTTNVDNRLRLVTDSTERLNAVYGELLDIANRTRTPLAANADLFNRFAIAGRETGKSYQDVLDVVERVNQALQISGTSAQAAEGALVQLGQGLSAGALRGEEFNSVNEAIPRLMQAIADEMGVARGALRELAADGAITSEVIFSALANQGDALAAEFAKITPTIAGAFEVFNNQMLDFVRNINAASGIGEIFANAILFLADNFNAVAGAAAGLAVIIGGVLLKAIAAMTIALAANPIGLVVVAIAAATAAIGFFGDKVVEVGGQTATVWQVMKAGIATVMDLFRMLGEWAGSVFTRLAEWAQGTGESITGSFAPFFERVREWLVDLAAKWRSMLNTVGGYIKTAINTYIGFYVGLVRAIGPTITEGIPALFRLAMGSALNIVLAGVQNIINAVVGGLGGIGDALSYIPGVADDLGDSIRGALDVNLDHLRADTEGLRAEFEATGAAISGTFTDALNTDYVGAFGDAVGEVATQVGTNLAGAVTDAGTAVGEIFNANLAETIVNQEASVNLNELMANGLNNAVTPALNGAGAAAGGAASAMDDLNKQREEFIEGIQDEYASIMEANGGAVASVQAWYQEQRMALQSLGLEYTQYADMLDVIFRERIAEAYQTDLENATDWRSGIERAVRGLGESVGTEADLAESALTSLFDNAANAIVNFAKTGKLDFKEFARSVAADILMLTTRMLLFKALSGIFGFANGGMAGGGMPGFANGGFVNYAAGGSVRGPGGPKADVIPAMLSNGEFVVNASATRDFLPLLEAINSGNMEMMGLARGGLANEASTLPAQPSQNQQQSKADEASGGTPATGNVVVNNYVTSKAIADALDTPDGEVVIMNIIEKNRSTVKGLLS